MRSNAAALSVHSMPRVVPCTVCEGVGDLRLKSYSATIDKEDDACSDDTYGRLIRLHRWYLRRKGEWERDQRKHGMPSLQVTRRHAPRLAYTTQKLSFTRPTTHRTAPGPHPHLTYVQTTLLTNEAGFPSQENQELD